MRSRCVARYWNWQDWELEANLETFPVWFIFGGRLPQARGVFSTVLLKSVAVCLYASATDWRAAYRSHRSARHLAAAAVRPMRHLASERFKGERNMTDAE